MSPQNIIKLSAIFLGLVALVIAIVDDQGGFKNRTRLEFVQNILAPEEQITTATPGFFEFVAAFPWNNVSQKEITGLRRDRLNSHDGYPISLTIRYVLSGDRVTSVVADKGTLESWANESSYAMWSFVVAFAAIVCVALLDAPGILRDWRERRKMAAEPATAPNGGPGAQVDNSGVAEGPPSVS